MQGRLTGVGRYLFNVVRHWTTETIAGRFQEVNFYTPQAIDGQKLPLPGNIRQRVLRPNQRMLMWENLRLAPFTTDDVLFCPSYSRPLLARRRTVVTIFDATLHLYPAFYPLSARLFYDRLYGWSARHATLVITSTETARQDIARSYAVPLSRIRVVYLAPAEMFTPLPGDVRLDEVRARYLRSAAPYFLFVGKLTARRNVPMLMEAFAEMKRRTSLPHKLLVTGLNTTDLNVHQLAAQLGIADDFRYCEYVPDEDLILLYNAAAAFVMPYAYEAVSLTALEAQATGTPVITVDTPGLRETTGGAALLIPTAEVGEIADALSRLAADPARRARLAEEGLANARRFSWQRCAAQTLTVIEEAGKMPIPLSAPQRPA